MNMKHLEVCILSRELQASEEFNYLTQPPKIKDKLNFQMKKLKKKIIFPNGLLQLTHQ